MRRNQRGSIMIELLVIIPLLVLCTLLIVQGIVIASGLGSIEVGAKDAARAAADRCSHTTPSEAARRAASEFVHVRDVQVSRSGDNYTAKVTARVRMGLDHLGAYEFDVSRSATMPRLSSCR